MIPEHRLADLLDYVKHNQIYHCLYHNTTEVPSLYNDHLCGVSRIPTGLALEVSDHSNEAWFVDFSHDGTKLATSGKDGCVYVYEVPSFRRIQVFEEHTAAVHYLAWSPDDKIIISCGKDNTARIWEVEVSFQRRPFSTSA